MRRKMLEIAVLAIALALPAASGLADQPADAWITTKVKMNLLAEPEVDPFAVDVDTIDGVVTLHGQVASAEAKRLVTRGATGVDGVRDVRNLVAVVPERARERVEAADEEIARRVAESLEADAALGKSAIEVDSVNDGTVVLSGRAATLSAHRRALEDARAVEGVRSVASEIQSPDRLGDEEIWSESASDERDLRDAASDTWLTTRAKLRLLGDPGLSPLAVNVDTRGAVVTLFGIVDSDATRSRAEAQVARIDGVKEVDNQLQVVPDVAAEGVAMQDEEIASAVEERLSERTALADADIDVEVKAGVVRLTGAVASYGDRLTALTVARSTEGVSGIIDDLRTARTQS